MEKIAKYIHKVQYYETDQMGIVHHSNYFRWFEEARLVFMEKIGLPYDRLEEIGIIIPVTAVSAKYLKAATFPKSIEIQSKITSYTGVRMTVKYQLFDMEESTLITEGETQHGFVGQDFRPMALQRSFPEVHEILLNYLVEE